MQSTAPAAPQIAHLVPRPQKSMRFTQRFPEEQLAGLAPSLLLIAASWSIEVFGLQFLGLDPKTQSNVVELVFAAGFVEYLRVVYRLHRALQIATGGAYPHTPWFAVRAHWYPLYNIYWLHGWTFSVAKCAARNGRVRRTEYIVPIALLVLGILPGFSSLSMRIALFLMAARYAQIGLVRAVRAGEAAEPG